MIIVSAGRQFDYFYTLAFNGGIARFIRIFIYPVCMSYVKAVAYQGKAIGLVQTGEEGVGFFGHAILIFVPQQKDCIGTFSGYFTGCLAANFVLPLLLLTALAVGQYREYIPIGQHIGVTRTFYAFDKGTYFKVAGSNRLFSFLPTNDPGKYGATCAFVRRR